MSPDPNLVRLQRQVNLVAGLAWGALGVAVLFFAGYLALAPLFHTPVSARVPIILGYAFVTAAAALQLFFAQHARRSFPRMDGMALKISLGVFGIGIGGFALASLIGLIVLAMPDGRQDGTGHSLLFGCCVLVFVPVGSYLLFAALRVREVDRKYGPGGASQLLAYQLYQEHQTQQFPPIQG